MATVRDILRAIFDRRLSNPETTFWNYLLPFIEPFKRTAAEIAAGVTPTDYSVPSHEKIGAILLARYGGDNTAASYSDTALNNAILVSANANHTTIKPSHGIYLFSGQITIPYGIMIVAEGSQGTNDDYGTVFLHDSNGDFLKWDGTGGAGFRGTGGGLKNVTIQKATGRSGGNAIYLYSTDDDHRPGEMVFENVLAYGTGTGLWARGLYIDGSNSNTAGGRGVRTIVCIKCRFADVTTAGETILLKQATHFYGFGVAVDTGDGSAAGVSIQGISDGIFFANAGIAGTVTIAANDASNQCNNFHFHGKCGGTFTCNDDQTTGTLNASVGGLANKSTDLRCMTDLNPYANVTNGTADTNVTGDATIYPVVFDTETTDLNNNFASNTFTCTVAGNYAVTFEVLLSDLDAAHTRSDISLIKAGSAAESVVIVNNPYAMATPTGFCSFSMSHTFRLEYGDTLQAKVAVTGGTKTVGVYGASSGYTKMSVTYVP